MPSLPDKIDRFDGEYRFLSNFYPFEMVFEGRTYATAEHAYQAAKARDEAGLEYIRAAPTPGEAKRRGRKVPLRADWEDAKVAVMIFVLVDKFREGPMAEKLLRTGEAFLEEGNTWGDRFWGTCNGEGRNVLGILLMGVRRALREADTLKGRLLGLELEIERLERNLGVVFS